MTQVSTIASGRGPYTQTHTILAASATSLSGAADTNENTLATILVPAGSMGASGMIRVTTLWSANNSVNNKIFRIKFGGTQFSGRVVSSTTLTFYDQVLISNRTASTQVSNQTNGVFGISTAAVATGTVDTTVNQNVTLTVQKASGADTATLESYLVELIRAD